MKHYQSINDEDEEGFVRCQRGDPLATLASSATAATDAERSLRAMAHESSHFEDRLTPPFDSPDRPSSLCVGTFNLIATVVGGGVLSLPVVFERCGVAFTAAAMIISASMTYLSLEFLCLASRRGGGSSYGEVVRSAFGERTEEWVSLLLGVYLMLSLVAYMVLARDVWTPLVAQVLRVDVDGDYVLLAITIFLLPFLFQRTLHALRKICYVGFASICLLCVALCRGGLEKLEDENNDFQVEFFKVPAAEDLLFSFPIITCAFLCHFNIISIQNALIRPTRKRMRRLIQYTIGACFTLLFAFGLGGYVYGGSNTQGNILLNLPTTRDIPGDVYGDYYLFLLGRIGCGVTIMLAMPMNLLPCREALLEVVDVWFHHSHHRRLDVSPTTCRKEEHSCWKMLHRFHSFEPARDAGGVATEDELLEILTLTGEANSEEDANPNECHPPHASAIMIRQDPIQSDYVFRNFLTHYGGTLLIVAACYAGAVAVTGVAAVWSFIGSSMAFLVAFAIPCGCFVVVEAAVPGKDEGGDRRDGWMRMAWAILAFSIVGAVVCTVNNTVGFRFRRW